MSTKVKDADEQEVFEIVDFTTASEWERFTAAVEEALHDWQLTNNAQKSPPAGKKLIADEEWQEQSVTLKFGDFPFLMTHYFIVNDERDQPQQNASEASVGCLLHYLKDLKGRKNWSDEKNDEEPFPQYISDMFNLKNDFPGKAHCLGRWYGLREFITLSSANPTHPISSVSKAKVVLSSLAIAANNTNCQVPLFIQTMDLSDKVYMGVGLGSGVRTDFEMAFVRNAPLQCTNFSGLLDVLKSKIGSSFGSAPTLVSVRFTYSLSDWPHTQWTQQPPDLDDAFSDVGFSELGRLPFGALSDPVSELQVSTTWPCMNECSVTDTDTSSYLKPSSAPRWSARLGSSPSPPCLLSEYLTEYLHVCHKDQSIIDILGHEFDPTIDDGGNIVSALDKLTASAVPSLSSIVSRARFKSSPKTDHGPVTDDILSLLLNFLFPDAQNLQEESAPYPSTFSQVPTWIPPVEGLPLDHPLKTVLRSMKTCAVDSFVWRLSVILCHVVHSLGGIPSVAHLVYEIMLELRFRWDNGIFIPGLIEGPPDMATCLVHQKLQMLNCCIQHRRRREERASRTPAEDNLEEEDEFFECEENVDREVDSGGSGKEYYSSWDRPEGRLKRFGNTRLLKRKDFLYIPVTQEAAPVTEDRLEEQTDELLRLGSDSAGSSQRARLMSSALLSDMESFKAANPGSVLEDFVRWYSPRDWIEEETITAIKESALEGHLSPRMLLPGNLWQEVWENAKPVPARRQKRLFDDTREAEKVLQWFYCLPPGKLCQQLLPVVMHASICRLSEEPVLYTLTAAKGDIMPQPLHCDSLSAQLEMLSQRVVRLSRQPPVTSNYQVVFEHIGTIERTIAKAQSLRLKLLGHTNISPISVIKSAVCSSVLSPTFDDNATPNMETESNDDKKDIPPLENLVTSLLNLPEVTLEGGSSGTQAAAIKKLFSDARNAAYLEDPPPEKKEKKLGPGRWDINDFLVSYESELGKPAGREYLLRTQAAFPADHSKVIPQRLYAVILQKSFRMAGAITQDTVFC